MAVHDVYRLSVDYTLADQVTSAVSGKTAFIPSVKLTDAAGTAGGTTTSPFAVGGTVAAGATDSGNPVKIGGKYNSTLPTLTNGLRGDVQLGTRGAQNVTLFYADTAIPAGNVDTAALVTATGATATQTGADQTNYGARGLVVVLDMTVVGTGSVTLTIQGKDAASGKYYTLLAGAAVITNSTNVYTVYPGAPVTTNVSASLPLPRTWRVLVTANNANATTYTVGASVIV